MSEATNVHLIERAAEQLRRAGGLDGAAAQLLAAGGTAAPNPVPIAATPPAPSADSHPGDARPSNAKPAEARPTDTRSANARPSGAEPPAEPGRAEPDQPEPRRADQASGVAPVITTTMLVRGGMVEWSSLRSRTSEEFRLVQRQILRNAFTHAALPDLGNLLMVTSAKPGEGKSFTAVNLAVSIARQGENRVVLVDADSKQDSLGHTIGLDDAPGLLDLASGPERDAASYILPTAIDRLGFLPIGLQRGRSAELFASKEMPRLISRLGRSDPDRLIILDMPPCLSTSDPAVLAPFVGQTLFVVQAEHTQREEVETSLDLIQSCPIISLLLNKIEVTTRYSFGAYAAYYSKP